eukprot:3796770-Alexandrium_andersonii.AAC.1
MPLQPKVPPAVPPKPRPPPGPPPAYLYADASRTEATRREDSPHSPLLSSRDSVQSRVPVQDESGGPWTVHTTAYTLTLHQSPLRGEVVQRRAAVQHPSR